MFSMIPRFPNDYFTLPFSDKQAYVQWRINQCLDTCLPNSPIKLHQAMRYACLDGGKRLRPSLIYATAEAYDTPLETLDFLAVAIELIHCYSLVHDDLPALDNDALRRGKPTCHKAFDEATAILVGDGLQSLAFELLSTANTSQLIKIIQIVSKAIGPIEGMVFGQALDIESTQSKISNDVLYTLHQSKTGALINACIQCSALACGEQDEARLSLLKDFGTSIGLAFQIQDDLLDSVGNVQQLGKNTQQDTAKQKNTFLTRFGFEEAKIQATHCIQKALHALNEFNKPANTLASIAHYFITRGV